MKVLSGLGTVGAALAAVQAMVLLAASLFGRIACHHEEESQDPANRPQAVGVREAFWYHKPGELDELYGGTVRGDAPGKWVGCTAEWTDEEPIFWPPGRRGGPRNGVEIVYWKTLTYQGRTVVGKYMADLGSWVSSGTGAAGFPSGGCTLANQRLVERLPPPAPPPPGYRAIVPGECVGSAFDEDRDRVVGRFVIDLPADRGVTILIQVPTGLPADLSEQLRFDGVDVPEDRQDKGGGTPEPTGRLRTTHAGRHELLVHRTDEPGKVPPAKTRGKIYTVQVNWGTNVGYACHPESARENLCF